MNPYLKWLVGLRQLPQEAGEGRWHLEFHSLPQGLSAVLAIVAAVVAVIGVWWLYRREGRNLAVGPRLLLGALRLLALGCLAVMLSDLVLVIDRRERVPSNLLVLVDTSESMALNDPYDDSTARRLALGMNGSKTNPGESEFAAVRDLTRLEIARKSLSPILQELQDGRQVTLYGFDSKANRQETTESLSELQARGISSSVGDALNQALAAHRGQPISGVLLVTDGQSNGGEDPRKVAQQSARDGTTINALVVGSEQGPSNIRLTEIEVSPVVFVRDPVPIGVLIESQGMRGRAARVKLDRRQAGEDWTEVGIADVSLGEDGQIQRVPFAYVPDSVGQYEFRGQVVEAGPELTFDDNTAMKTMKVVRQRIRVLVIAGAASPEVQFMRNALLRDPVIELACWLQSAGENYEQVGHRPVRRLPSNLQELSFFDVVVLIDPNVKQLGAAWDEMLTKFVGEAGGGLIYVAGEMFTNRIFESTSGESGNSADLSWVEMLPVVWEPGLYQSTADVQLSARETWNLELTADGSEDPVFRFSPDQTKNREILASLPGMYWHFPVTRAKPGAAVLAQHGDQRMRNQFGRHVLMALQRFGPGRTVFIGFDATYRWRYLHEHYFDGFWARLIDRVGRAKVLGGRYPFTLSTDKSVYRTGDRVILRVQLTGAQEEIASLGTLNCEVEVTGADPVSYDLVANAEQPGLLETSFTAEKGGPYTVRVFSAAQAERDSSVRPATHTFRVEPPRQETDKPGTNRALLEDITKATNGKLFTVENASEIPAAFSIKEVERLIQYREELWDAPLWLFVIVGVMTAEWVLRKLYRLA